MSSKAGVKSNGDRGVTSQTQSCGEKGLKYKIWTSEGYVVATTNMTERKICKKTYSNMTQ